jgi:hypothetical protein
LLVTAEVPSTPIFVTLMVELICASETSVLTGATERNIPKDGILHRYRRENLRSYIRSSIIRTEFANHMAKFYLEMGHGTILLITVDFSVQDYMLCNPISFLSACMEIELDEWR